MALDRVPFPADSPVRYWDVKARGGVFPSGAWEQPGYDDSAWTNGWAYLVNNDTYAPAHLTGYLQIVGGQTIATMDQKLNHGPTIEDPIPVWTHLVNAGGTRVYARATFTVTVAGTYNVWFIGDNNGTLYVDGVSVGGTSGPSFALGTTIALSSGTHTIAWTNAGDGFTDLAVASIFDGGATQGPGTFHFELRADSSSGTDGDTVTVNVRAVGSDTTDLGNYTSFGALATGDAPWRSFDIPLPETMLNRVEISRVGGSVDMAHVRNVWVDQPGVDRDYGQYPLGYPYTPDVQDGMLGSTPILNDSGTLPGSAYYAEQGEPIEPSVYNYSRDFRTLPVGTHIQDYDGWINYGGEWALDGGGAVQNGYDTPAQGVPLFSLLGHDCYPVLRPDGFRGAPRHNIQLGIIGSARGMSNIGPIWGWNSWDDYFFCWAGGHADTGVYRVQGGVPTLLGVVSGGNGVTVEHDFITGDLHVDVFDAFMGTNVTYDGNHPHSVAAGRQGWMADRQNTGIFGDTTWVTSFATTFAPGVLGYNRQYSMQTLEVVPQVPLTWYFPPDFPPPLRWLQRDDRGQGYLRGRRVDNEPSSRQVSLRQGWKNTYL